MTLFIICSSFGHIEKVSKPGRHYRSNSYWMAEWLYIPTTGNVNTHRKHPLYLIIPKKKKEQNTGPIILLPLISFVEWIANEPKADQIHVKTLHWIPLIFTDILNKSLTKRCPWKMHGCYAMANYNHTYIISNDFISSPQLPSRIESSSQTKAVQTSGWKTREKKQRRKKNLNGFRQPKEFAGRWRYILEWFDPGHRERSPNNNVI